MDRDRAQQLAAAHVAAVRLGDPDYRMDCEFCGALGEGWLFAYRVRCLKPIPEAAQDCFAGAGGFIVSASGAVRILSVPEFVETQAQLG